MDAANAPSGWSPNGDNGNGRGTPPEKPPDSSGDATSDDNRTAGATTSFIPFS